MVCLHPQLLWLLLLGLPLIAVHLRRHERLGTARSVTVATIRCLAVLALLFALARPSLLTTRAPYRHVTVVDTSTSVSSAALASLRTTLQSRGASGRESLHELVIAGSTPRHLPLTDWLAEPAQQADGASLVAALRLAGALIPHDGRGEIHLYTDGLAAGGDVPATAHQLAMRGIPVCVTPLAVTQTPHVVLTDVAIPAFARVGAGLTLTATIYSNITTTARVELQSAGQVSEERIVDLHPGVQPVRFTWSADRPGVQRLSVRVEAADDSRVDDNTRDAAVAVGGPQRVLVIGDAPTTSTAQTLRTLLGSAAQIEDLAATSERWTEVLDTADLLVLADVPAASLSRERQIGIRDAIRDDGLGLLVTGGRRSFGAGGYANTPIADVLPVSMFRESEHRDPSTSLVIIIDTSGSMGGPRVSLAKEIARLAIARLKPHDKVGVVEFYGSKRWAAPIQPASNAIAIQRALNRLSSGGGTVILPALEEAYYALQNVRTRTRHVLVLTDGGVETGAFEPLIRKMADADITVSTVLVGPGRHSTFLAALARWGGGRAYTAPDRFTLPEVIVKQPQSARLAPFVTGEFLLKKAPHSDVLAGIRVEDAPPLAGCNPVDARRAAETLLSTTDGMPVLVRWRHGVGAVAAWTSHLGGPWSAQLGRWPSFPQLVGNLVRSLSRPARDAALDVRPIIRPGGLELDIRVQRFSIGNAASGPILLRVEDGTGGSQERVVDPLRPGRWNVLLPDVPAGVARISAQSADHGMSGTAVVVVPPSCERVGPAPPEAWFNEFRALESRAEARARLFANQPPTEVVELWPGLVAASLLLMLLQVLIRRWPVRPPEGLTVGVLLVTFAVWMPSLAGAQVISDEGPRAEAFETVLEAERFDSVDDALAALTEALASRLGAEIQFALHVRAALLHYERDAIDAARASLRTAMEVQPNDATRAYCAQLASLARDVEMAAEWLPPEATFERRMFHGLWLMRSGRPGEAGDSFAAAESAARLSRDRRFARAQRVAAARATGGLEALADAWMSASQPDAAELEALVSVLRDLGRTDAVLDVLRDMPTDSGSRRVVRLHRELLTILIETQREAEAEALYRTLLEQEPQRVDLCRGLARLLLLQDRREAAEDVFIAAVHSTEQPAELLALGDAACTLGLYDAGLAAAVKARRTAPRAHVDALLFEARVARERGQTDHALELVRRAATGVDVSPVTLKRLAEAYERLGDPTAALQLLQRLYEHTGAEDVLLRIAWLLETSGRLDEAYTLWMELWRTTDAPARRRQAQERLLNLAARTERLADLAIEIEQRLDTGTAHERELELLVELYTTVSDAVSAAEILYQFGRQSGDQVAALERLARVYLSCEQFGRCDAVLRRLVELNPSDAPDYLQQVAMLAVERQRPADLLATLEPLRAASGEARGAELTAGLLALAGMHREAAREYEALLQAHPDRIEAWLLWGNAMRDGGQRILAVRQFLRLLDQADAEDLFAVAVDGLLNLDAPPTALRYAVRRVLTRIAAQPKRVFLYRLAADLLDAVGDLDGQHALLEQAVLIAGDQRTQILRELMDSARAAGRRAEAVSYGRLLLAMGDELPPQALLELGETLLDEERFAEAARAFERAAIVGERVPIYQRVARLYEEAGQLAIADRILRELLIAAPDDVEVLLRSAVLAERQWQPGRAFRQYRRGIELLLARLPTEIGVDPAATPDVAHMQPFRWRTRNVDTAEQSLDRALRGVLRTMDDSEAARPMLAELASSVRGECDRLRKTDAPGDVLRAHPRLARSAQCLRQLAFATRYPAVADEVDGELIDHFPRDPQVAITAVRERLAWGLTARAHRLGERAPKLDRPAKLLVDACGDAALPDERVLEAVNGDASAEMRLVGRYLVNARPEPARRVLRQIHPMHEGWETVAHSAIALAVMLNEDELVARWTGAWLTKLERTTVDRVNVDEITACVEATWLHLTSDQQAALVHQIGRHLAQAQDDARAALSWVHTRLRVALNMPLVEATDASAPVPKDADARDIAWLMRIVAPEERTKWLRRATGALPAVDVRPFVRALAGALIAERDLDPAIAAALAELYSSAAPEDAGNTPVYRAIRDGEWIEAAVDVQEEAAETLLREIARGLLRDFGETSGGQAVAARVQFALGNQDAAVQHARQALAHLLAQPQLTYDDVSILDDLVDSVPRDAVVALLPDGAADEAPATLHFVRAMLLEKLDRTDASLTALRAAYELVPENRLINRRLIARFETAGRIAELVDVLSAHLSRATIMESYEWRTLARLQRALYRPADAMRSSMRDASPLGPVTILKAAQFAGDVAHVRAALQQFAATGPTANRHWDPTWPSDPGVGGLAGWIDDQRTPRSQRPRMFRALADMPFVAADYAAWLRAAPPGQRDISGLTAGLARAWDASGELPSRLKSLQALHEQDGLTTQDHWLLLHATSTTAAVFPELHRLIDVQDHAQLERLASCANTIGHDHSGLLMWLIALDARYGYSSAWLDERFQRMQRWLAALPKAQRPEQATRLARFLRPTPLEPDSDAILARRVELLAGANAEDREKAFRLARRRVESAAGARRYPQTAAVLARIAARAGHWTRYEHYVDEALRLNRSGLDGRAVVDARVVLPAESPGAIEPCVTRLTARLINDSEAGNLSRATLSRSLALLAHKCCELELREVAADLETLVADLRGDAAEHWLWHADLLRRMGDRSAAHEIERTLATHELLPIARSARLLAEAAQIGDAVGNDDLTVHLASLTDHPAVLKRARDVALRTGDSEALADYEARLERWSPAVRDHLGSATFPGENAE